MLIENNFFLSNSGANSVATRKHPVQPKRAGPDHPRPHSQAAAATPSSPPSIRPPATPSARIYGNAAYRPAHSQPDNYAPCDTRAIYSHNIWRGATCSPTDLNADPLFISLTDLHLRRGSPAIDRGDASRFPKRDIDGSRRPDGRTPIRRRRRASEGVS